MPLTGTHTDKPMKRKDWDIRQSEYRELVRERLGQSVDPAWIARDLGMKGWEVRKLIQELDEERADEIARAPRSEVGFHLRYLQLVVEKMGEAVLKGRPVLNDKGKAILDKDGAPVMVAAIAEAKTIIAALQRRSKLLGADAPDRHVNISMDAGHAQSPINPALMADPEYARHVLALEQREREIAARTEGVVDVSGEVRGAGDGDPREGGAMALPPPPDAPQRDRDGGRLPQGAPATDIDPSTGREGSGPGHPHPDPGGVDDDG